MDLVLAGRLSQKTPGQTGLDTQDEDARDWATQNGHRIVYAAADHISGRVLAFNRPKLGPWLNDSKLMALYGGVLFSKMDRATRARDWDIRKWAEKHGKKLIIAQPYLEWPPKKGDIATPIIWDDLVNIAAAEWENTSMRYSRMHKALTEQAFFVGKPPFPYRIIPVEGTEHKTLEPDPERSIIAKRMATFYLDGWSTQQIADWLNQNGYPQPQPPKGREGKGWSSRMVHRILSHPSMTGRIQWSGKTYLRVEEIISLEKHQRILTLMRDRQRSRGGGRNPGASKHGAALLTGMIYCPSGHPMYRFFGRRTDSAPEGYYYCRACPKGERLLAPIHLIDAAVDDAVMTDANIPHLVSDAVPVDEYAKDVDRVKDEIRKLARDPEADGFIEQTAAKHAELANLRKLQAKAKSPKVEPRRDGDKTIGDVWQSLDAAGKRRWLLARKGSEWLPDQTKASVTVYPRTNDGQWPTNIDLGDSSDVFGSLVTL